MEFVTFNQIFSTIFGFLLIGNVYVVQKTESSGDLDLPLKVISTILHSLRPISCNIYCLLN